MKTKLSAVLFALALFAGTAGAQVNAGDAQQYSGFLGDYSKLEPAPNNPKAKLWFSKDFDFRPYRRIVLDPIETWVSPTSEYKGVSPDTLKQMGETFISSLKKALWPEYQIVNKPAPNVLRMRLALTGIHLVPSTFKPIDALPIKLIFNAVRSAAGESPYNVVLTGEVQVLDHEGNVVGAALSSGTSDETVTQKQDITWKDLQSITDQWAASLRRQLDELRGVAVRP